MRTYSVTGVLCVSVSVIVDLYNCSSAALPPPPALIVVAAPEPAHVAMTTHVPAELLNLPDARDLVRI
jgi:hypothetical protein